MCVRLYILPFSRRYQTDLLSLWLRQLKIISFTDTLFSGVKSLIGNTCAQVFTDGKFMHIHTMKSEKEAGYRLQKFKDDVGILTVIIRGDYGEQST